jgi:hypothetical protein
MTKPKITAERFDQIASAPPRIIWTASAIARRVGCSSDFVRNTLANQPGSPVKKIGTRYCAIEADLISFFRA